MQQPLISVIVPCYNQAQYLDECLQSVLDQTYKNWECIIVNDGSPDNTEDVALDWIKKDSRFKYIKKENGGLSSARNAGIEIANGEWILPLDCDDKIGNRYLDLAEKEFDNGYTIIYAKAFYFNDNNKYTRWDLKEFKFENFLIFNHIYCSSFFKKSDWIKVGGYDKNFIYGREDWDFWTSILDRNSKVKLLNYDGFFYRVKENSMNVSFNNDNYKKLETDIYFYKKHLNKYLEFSENPIDNYKEIQRINRDFKRINSEIKKNILTKGLYKAIELLKNV